ncbi:MAG: hypothetical protein WD118_03405 [Phycisphaeraceae bacterium]
MKTYRFQTHEQHSDSRRRAGKAGGITVELVQPYRPTHSGRRRRRAAVTPGAGMSGSKNRSAQRSGSGSDRHEAAHEDVGDESDEGRASGIKNAG